MEETFLSRFDGLDVRVRKTLQTCAVLGLSFALSDVIQVHPEMEEFDIEDAIDSAVDEMILVEQIEDNDLDDTSSKSSKSSNSDASESEVSDSHTQTFTFDRTANSDNMAPINDRYFQFSHAMWRKNVLTTMLKERKVELHRLIAESMEKNQILNVEESDISRLLTLFEHWKSCGDFSKSAPLAILVGSRLEDWDLSAQSLELYEDALQMSFESVTTTEETDSEWISVSAKPQVLDLILRLHVRVGLCHRRLGDEAESLAAFEDAYRITKTASKIPSASRELMMPILSSLCVLKTSQPVSDPHTRAKLENLLEKFVEEAKKNKKPVYVGRSMSMQAAFFVKNGKMEKAVRICEKMCQSYNVAKYSGDMVAEYGQDTVIECLAESVQWYYLIDKHAEAEEQADVIIERYLPLVDSTDTDACMRVVLPIIQVLRLVNRAKDADWLLKRYIINPAHDQAANSEFWIPIFNPLAYVIELIIMEEAEEYDALTLKDLEEWILNDENSDFDYELERKAHTLMGEICWRLANFHDDDSKTREELEKKGKSLLMPVAQYPHDEVFLRRTAIAIMEAF
jgi:tetratricopeptide (TPR) repeat protein